MDPSQRRRERLLLPLGVMALCVVATVGLIARQGDRAEGLVVREDAALRALRKVAAAEETYRRKNVAYGWLDDLERAGLVPREGFREEDGGFRVVRTDGYQIDVLLPVGPTATGGTRVSLRGTEPADPVLAASQFVVLARPTEPGVSGLRTWYVDARGIVRFSDGVLDQSGRRASPLPRALIDRDGTGEEMGDLWRSLPH